MQQPDILSQKEWKSIALKRTKSFKGKGEESGWIEEDSLTQDAQDLAKEEESPIMEQIWEKEKTQTEETSAWPMSKGLL
jgi:hypothetical protein